MIADKIINRDSANRRMHVCQVVSMSLVQTHLAWEPDLLGSPCDEVSHIAHAANAYLCLITQGVGDRAVAEKAFSMGMPTQNHNGANAPLSMFSSHHHHDDVDGLPASGGFTPPGLHPAACPHPL